MKEADELLEDLLMQDDKLNEWERDFVQSLMDQMDNGRQISPLQRKKMEQIWDRLLT